MAAKRLRTGCARRWCATSLYGWDPVTNPAPAGPWRDQKAAAWPRFDPAATWLAGLDLCQLRGRFERDGYAVVPGLVPAEALEVYRWIHDQVVSGQIDAGQHRHDLGGHKAQARAGSENVGQVMWPSDLVAGGRDGPIHQRGYQLARALIGEDAEFDFDMMIWKNARTETETPWHQDEAYWPSGMGDKRALTVWCALDRSTVENGAMWYVKGSHNRPLLPHRTASEGSHILMTEHASEAEGSPVELEAGSAVVWAGRTCHYSRGNSTDTKRRTFIVNFRPGAMVKWERENGFDHLRKGFDDYDNQMEHAGDVYSTTETSTKRDV